MLLSFSISLEWWNRTWVCPHTVQNEEMVPYAHPAVSIRLFFFCRNEAAQILARQPWTMANMGWCALTVQKTDMTSKRKGVGKFSIKWREEQRKWKWREKGNVWQINLKKEPRVWAPSIPPCPHYSPGVDVCPFNLLNPLRDWSSLSFPLQNEINLKHAFRFHL